MGLGTDLKKELHRSGRFGWWVSLFLCLAITVAVGIFYRFAWRIEGPLKNPEISARPFAQVQPSPAPASHRVSMREQPKAPARTGLAPLDLKLLGILLREKQEEAIAVIRDTQREKAGLYRLGDRLPRGATLAEIASGRVVVHRSDGGMEVLPLEALEKNAEGFASGVVTPLSSTERLVDKEAMARAALPVLVELSQVKFKPSVSEGKLLGFGVQGAYPGGILHALGLEEGDVISAIDGQPLGNYRQATELLGNALQRPPFTLTVIKKDKRETFTYHLAP